MASQLHRQAALANTLQAQQEKEEEWKRTLEKMQQKTEEQVRQGDNHNWHEGRLAAIHESPPLRPVVVGDRSLFKRPEDLSNFLGEFNQFTTTAVFELDNDMQLELENNPNHAADILSSAADLPTLLVCELDARAHFDIETLTKGEWASVWFQGKCLDAWVPKTLQEVNQIVSDARCSDADHVPGEGEFFILIGELGGERSMFETTEELRHFLHLPILPRAIHTTETFVKSDKPWLFSPGELQQHRYPTKLVACVTADQYREVKDRTVGHKILVWFPNNVARYTWLARAIVSNDNSMDDANGPKDLPEGEKKTPTHAEVEEESNGKPLSAAEEDEDDDFEKLPKLMKMKAEQSERRYKNCNWQEAARLASLPQPPKLHPIIVGDNSLFKSAEEISSFLGLPHDYPLSTTFELPFELEFEIYEHPNSAADLVASKADILTTVSFCAIHTVDFFALENLTLAGNVEVWFQGESRAAMLPKSLREFKQHLEDTEPATPPVTSERGRYPVVIGNLGGNRSLFETAEDLRNYLSLPETPAVFKTVETQVDMSDKPSRFRDDEPHQQQYLPQLVSFVNATQLRQIENATIGRFIVVWFPNNIPRLAWFPANPKGGQEKEDSISPISSSQDMGTDRSDATVFGDVLNPTVGEGQESKLDHSQEVEKAKARDEDVMESSGCGLRLWIKDICRRVESKFRRSSAKE